MGKFPNSVIHNRYSDWHIGMIQKDEKYKRLYQADIDRLWIEYDFTRKEIVGVVDIKWEYSCDSLTPTEEGIYCWFEKHNVRVYTVFITKEFDRFRVINSRGKEKIFNETEYADFLLSLRSKR